MKPKVLGGILFLGLLIMYLACQKDDSITNVREPSKNAVPKIETIAYDGHNTIFNTLKTQLHLDRYKESKFSQNIQGKSTTDTLGLIIATDIIKQVTLGDYTSYTMKIVHENDSTVFYNLTIEYKNGATDLFITKYTPTAYWLNNTNETYQGEVQSKRATLTQYTDPEEAFEEELGGGLGNPDLGAGVGGGSGVSYSADYPWDCMGTVIVSTELVPYQCTCENHWPWDDCDCSDQPGYDQIVVYACEEHWDVDPYDPGDTSNPGGGSTDPIPDDPAITVTIKPEDCTEHIDGDLDGDCVLSEYERCVKENYNTEVCDCVYQGAAIADCLDNDCAQLKAITDVPITNTRLYQLRTSNTNFEKGFKVIKNPSNNTYIAGDIIDNNSGNCNAVKIGTHAYTAVVAHTHPSCVAYKMFSAEDILKLATMADRVQSDTNSTVQLTELTHIVVFNGNGLEGTFAIRFDDETSVQVLQNIANNKGKKELFLLELQEAYRSDFDNTNGIENTSIAKQQAHLFKHLEKYNLNISLYKANLDANNKVDHWKKINKDTLEQEACN